MSQFDDDAYNWDMEEEKDDAEDLASEQLTPAKASSVSNPLDETRAVILSIDTTYEIGKNTTKEFLPPNFYIDRLVKATDRYAKRLVIAELEKQAATSQTAWVIRNDVQSHEQFIHTNVISDRIATLTAELDKP